MPQVQRSYTLGELIGTGAFSSVYKATFEGANGFVKEVAIKVLKPLDHNDREMELRLRDEARLLGLIRHRAIVSVDDLVELGDGWGVVMEYLPGADLAGLLTLGTLPARAACELITEAATALDVAHRAVNPRTGDPLAVVHRDIKPANLRLTPSGEVKILDFGVARATFRAREAATTRRGFGSFGYMAPERFEGETSPAADVYALGVVLLECLTGAGFMGAPASETDRAEQALRSLRGLVELPDALADLVLEMIEYHAADRPTAAGVARRLRAIALQAPGIFLAEWAPLAIVRWQAREEDFSEDTAAAIVQARRGPAPLFDPEPDPTLGYFLEEVEETSDVTGWIPRTVRPGDDDSMDLSAFMEDDLDDD